MPRFRGIVIIAGKGREVEVVGEPAGRISVRVDGALAYDKKPFIARDHLEFAVSGRLVTLRWRHPGLTHLECDIHADQRVTTLSTVTSSGEIRAPLEPEKRSRLELRAAAIVAMAIGVLILVAELDSFQRGHYHPKLLFLAPNLVLGGLLLLILRPTNQPWSDSANRILLAVGIPLGLVIGWLLSCWFLAAFAPPGP